ncbi:uncharacterized protein LOC113213735 [Frankliniella occidentalis]|uniref:Uncharacterized protein LOC113213735 n=1 Tax=Frankliniella occidentalis TaxID=133901 RepID=A0A9C6U4X2_FRAOC|nr:uncharacterized protein LOC113213735 [Frankliniella occidentalis]
MALKGEDTGPKAADTAAAEAEACAALDGAVAADPEQEVVNLNPGTLEEALRTIRVLQKQKAPEASAGKAAPAQQLLKWQRRALAYEEALAAVSRSGQAQLQVLSGQLMLLKSRLVRKQKDIGRMLAQREAVIQRQARTIQLLQTRLQEAGTSSQSCKGDSNSSIDETPSVDESSCSTATSRVGYQYGSLEVLTDPGLGDGHGPRVPPSPNHVVTYNRVMSNHRSVTKPKDVKYKRINKAKSKSLEELRGRLRNWVDKGITSTKFISLDQSYA